MQTSNKIGTDPIYDAQTLGTPRMLVLGVQHMFAMFGATVLVPALTGLNVATTLLLAGLGTLLFHLITKGKVPAFLGSSFAFLGGYWAIAPNGEAELLPYACVGVACAGLLYILLASLFKTFGAKKVMRFFPPIVTGPIIISIGLTLSSSALDNCATNWWIALVAILVVVVCNIWGKGMVKIIPILLGVVASYLAAALGDQVDFTPVREAAWIGLPVHMENTVFSLIQEAILNKTFSAKLSEEEEARFQARQADRQRRMEEARVQEQQRKQKEQKKKTLREKQQAAQAAKAVKAAKAATSTTEAGRVGDRPYARGRAYKADRYDET